MRALHTLQTLCGVALLGAIATAQSGPGLITSLTTQEPVFNSTTLGNAGIYDTNGFTRHIVQINFTKSHPNDTAGKWTAALTVWDLATTYGGGAGKQYVIMGQYDTTGTTPTFTPSTLANAMNNTAKSHCFGLMIEARDGLFAAVDWSDGPYVSWRKDNKSAFPTPVKITNGTGATPLPSGAYIDPTVGYVDNKLKLFYIDKVNSILMQDLQPTFTSGVLTKIDVMGRTVTVATTSTGIAHSPTPIVDKGGEVRGLWMASVSGSDSDMYFMPSLNANDTPIKVFDNTAWMNNGGVAGGRLMCANTGVGTSASWGEAAWLVGSNTTIGGTATMTLGCRNSKSAAPVVSKIALSLKLNAGTSTPLPIPGWNGSYALAGPIVIFTSMVALDKDETAHWSQSVPQDNTLKGLRVAIQALAQPQGLPASLTNTATLEFK